MYFDVHLHIQASSAPLHVAPFKQGLLLHESVEENARLLRFIVQANFDMTDSMGPGKLVRHMQNPSYTYDEYLICI